MININIDDISKLLDIEDIDTIDNIFENNINKINSIHLYINQYYNYSKLFVIKDNTYIMHGFCYLIDNDLNKTYWMFLSHDYKFYNIDFDIDNMDYNKNIILSNNLNQNILESINLYHCILKDIKRY